MGPDQLALMIPIIAVCIPIVAIWTKHQQRMAEIKAQQGVNLSPDVRAEMNRLREEVAALRETTTRFDMSFDAALTHLEDRMDKSDIERGSASPLRSPVAVPTETLQESLYVGQGR